MRMGRPEFDLTESQRIASPLGSAIRQRRRYLNMSVSELAELSKLGMSGQSYLSKLELGDIGKPGEVNIRKIAPVLGVDPEELLALRSSNRSHLTLRQLQREVGLLRQALENAGIPILSTDSEIN